MLNKEVANFIRACTYCQLVSSCSHGAQQLIQMIKSDKPFDVVFIGFWELGDIPDWDEYRKILTWLYCITGFGIGSAIGLKEITSDQAAKWAFGNFFVPFGLLKMIVVDADGLFDGMFKNTFKETLLISVHEVTRGNYKAIINGGFHRYLEKVHKINPAGKGSIH